MLHCTAPDVKTTAVDALHLPKGCSYGETDSCYAPLGRYASGVQVVRNNDLEEKVHLLESADEWPFLKEALAGPGTVFEEGEGEANQEHLLCDALVGEPFYYRVRDDLVVFKW